MKTTSKYSPILELIEFWQEFEDLEILQGRNNQDFSRFAVWLSRRIADNKRILSNRTLAEQNISSIEGESNQNGTKTPNRNKKPQKHKTVELRHSQEPVFHTAWEKAQGFETLVQEGKADVMDFHKYLPLEAQISVLLTRMNRFSVFYVKKAFQGLPISNSTEFGILAGIKSLGSPRKTDVINYNLLEKTTGTELLKRMANEGLVSETDDEEDKRSKRVKLTRKGEQLVEEASQRLMQLSTIVTGNLSHTQKHEMAQMLIELDDFHEDIYFGQTERSIQEIIEHNVLQSDD